MVGNFHAACAADILVGTLGQESEADEHEDERDTDPAVAAALAGHSRRIAPLYRDVIERHYFQNQTRQDIAARSGSRPAPWRPGCTGPGRRSTTGCAPASGCGSGTSR